MIEAVLFDLDGTLWDRDAAFRALVESQHHTLPELAAIPLEHFVERMIALDAYGFVDKRIAYAQLVSECGLNPTVSAILFDDFTTRYRSYFDPFPEVIATLHWLRERGLRLGIITNGSAEMQQLKIERLGLASLMDTVLISEREGLRKPDAAIFERALNLLAVDAASVWFVGDHPDADVRGASEAGLTAVWRRSRGEARHAAHTIDTLDELIPLLAAAGV